MSGGLSEGRVGKDMSFEEISGVFTGRRRWMGMGSWR